MFTVADLHSFRRRDVDGMAEVRVPVLHAAQLRQQRHQSAPVFVHQRQLQEGVRGGVQVRTGASAGRTTDERRRRSIGQ